MHTPASAYLASSSSSSAVPATSALVQFCRATSSVLHQGFKNEIKDDSSCQVAQDLPPDFWQSSAVPVDASSLVKDGIRSKTLLSPPIALNVSNPALECVQCVEVLHTDTMNHVVPELDDMGREIDVIWQPTDLVCPSKGKRDGRQTRRPDYGFVPEGDFEELCWEDGQLLVVMQGLNNKGNLNKRSCWQMSAGEMTAPHLELPTGGSMDTTFDTLGTEDLMDLPTINMQTEEDDLLTWLQQAPEELADKCEIVSDTTIANGQDCERLYQSDLTNPGIKCSCVNPEDVEVGEVSKACRNDTGVALPMKAVHHGDTSQKVPSSISIPSTTITCKDPYVPCLGTAKLGIPSPLMHSVTVTQSTTVHIPCHQSLPTGSTTAMNFGNFSRPAASIKANLQSLCMASGPSGPERLKQLDRVAVDASKSICSRTKSLRLIAPRREESILPSVMGSVGASTVCNATQTYPLDREAEEAMPAVGGFNGCSGVGGQSDGWNSSIISSTAVGTERSTEVLGAMEHSDTSSGESEDSEGIRRKRAPDKGKRGFCGKDSEIRSKALERKSHTMVVESLKRSRAAENHNQSERRRRDRISEKMKILQSLVPNAHKTDKASMLEEAIAYIKALKAQIQMMSYISGSYFTPMHMPHVQMAPPWPQMSMGLGMNMEMGMFNMTKFSPMFHFPGAVFPTIHATAAIAPNSFHPAHVMANHGIPHSAHNSANQMLLPVGSGSTVNVTSFKTYPASQQERLVQCTNPGVVRAGTFGNGKAHAPQSVPLSTCMAGLRSVQQK